MKDIQFASFDNQMKEQITVGQARRALIYGLGVGLLTACGVDVILNQAEGSTPIPNSSGTESTASLPIPTSTEVVNGLGDYEFIEQSEIITKLAGPFKAFTNDQRIKDLFKDPSTIEYSASGIKVYDINGQPTAYTFFSATSEVEEKGRTAMVFGGDQGEVIYIVLNRMLSSEGNVGLGITQDPITGNDLEKSLLIFDTELSEAEVANMTIEELSSRNINFIPGGVLVPTERLLGSKVNAMLIKPEIPPESLLPAEVKEKFDQAGIDLKDMTNAKYDKNGLSITLENGEVLVLNNAELEKNIYLGQDNVLQYRDIDGKNVIYAYDKETGKWGVESEAVLQAKVNFKKYGYPLVGLKIVENENGVVIIDPETGVEIYVNGNFDLRFAVENATDLMPTNYKPIPESEIGNINRPQRYVSAEYFVPLINKTRQVFINSTGSDPFTLEKSGFSGLMLDPDQLAWGLVIEVDRNDPNTPQYLVYETNNKVLIIVPVKSSSLNDVRYFWVK